MPLDMSAATAPPKKSTPNSSSRSTNRKSAPVPVEAPMSNIDRRATGLMGLGELAQGVCLITGLYADAATIGQHFPPVAMELAKIADTNEVVSKPIDFMIEIGPYGALIAALMPFGMQIAANHGWIDASRLMGQGVVPPAVLDAQMKTQMMEMQAKAVREQNAAVAAAQKAQQELQDALKAQMQEA